MSKSSLLPLVLLLAAPTLTAKQKVEIPDVITAATYVMVTTYDGDVFSPNVLPEDRKAVAEVQQEIEKWGRYKLVYTANQPDLILVVRTGRWLEARAGFEKPTSIGPGAAPAGSGHSIGAEVGDPQDTLEVFVAPANIKTATPMWRGRAVDGLKAPELRLVNEFREKVEAAARKKH